MLKRGPQNHPVKAAIDLFLQAYLDEKFGATNTASSELVPDFMSLAVDNVKSLLLGGHDTTASAIAYIIALLSEPENKDAFERVRMKHDSVFGPNPQEAAEKLMTDHPKLRNTLPLTTAAIKEAMRLFPPALSSRTTTPGHPLRFVTFNGRTLPIAGQQILISHYDMGQREDLWPEPPKFNLDRYSPGVPQVKHAWRSFEKGPRGCAGLELAKMEMRIVHVLLARELDFELAFPDDAPRAPSGHGVAGGRGYQIIEFAAKPVGHMPMPVRRREKANI